MSKKWRRKNKRQTLTLLLTLFHFVASLFYEPLLFGESFRLAFSGGLGSVATALASKFFGILFIYLFWHMFLRLIYGEYDVASVTSFFILLIVSLSVIALLYPQMYQKEIDDLLIYKSAIIYQPLYWHHYLTGAFYSGSYMLFPHPLTLILVQDVFFCALISSVFSRLGKRFGCWRAAPVFAILLLPASFWVQYVPYRNSIYALVCMYVVSELIFAWIDTEKPKLTRLIPLSGAFALIAIWRGEGALLFLLLPLGLLLACGQDWKRTLILSACSAGFAVLLALPQSVGMAQSGSSGDYKIVSTMYPLMDIYNAENCNLSYDGAEKDIAIVERVVPSALLKEYGLNGYRAYNAANGRGINQSGLTSDEVAAYLHAYIRIVFHNPVPYLYGQGNRCLDALRFQQLLPKSVFHGEHTEQPAPTLVSNAKDIMNGIVTKLEQGAFWRAPEGSATRAKGDLLRAQANNFLVQYGKFVRRGYLMVYGLTPFAVIALVILLGRRRKVWFPVVLALLIAAEFCAVVLLAPEGRTAYYLPVIYCIFLYVLMLAPYTLSKNARKKQQHECDLTDKGFELPN